MVFSELIFLYVFLPLCLILNLMLKNMAAKNIVLLAASLLFYAWGEPICVLLMVGISLASWGFGLAIERWRKKSLVWLFVLLDLSAFVYFKYSGFIVKNVETLLGFESNFVSPVLPIGISFYTFQIISYIIDVYRGNTRAQKNLLNFMLYVSLFPQLIAGPIVRYVDVEKEIGRREITAEGFTVGVYRFVAGLGKKVILANTIGSVVKSVLEEPVYELGTLAAWGVMLCYAFQIYFDFSGYSDMALGLGKMLGLNYLENFNYPYISGSIKEFWRRWHISMSSFFRDYVYIPLGGNRRHQALNMLVVWLLTGLWHGAGWNFVLWGLYFFVLLSFERFVLKGRKLPKPLGIPLTFALTVLGWTLFYFEDMGECALVLKKMLGFGGASLGIAEPVLLSALPVMAICFLCATPLPMKAVKRLTARLSENVTSILGAVWTAAMLLICTALIVSSTYNPFLYFRF